MLRIKSNHVLFAMLIVLAVRFDLRAQTLVFDPGHFSIVNENTLMRQTAERIHQNSLQRIKKDLDNINLDVNSVALVQDIILQSLATVDGTLKNGLEVKKIAGLISDISRQCNQVTALAGSDPLLLLFAQDVVAQLGNRGLNLATEVSSFVLKEGDNVLMDYEKRDFLLRKVILELQVMRALTFSIYKTMYWTKVNGFLKSANPYRNFINQDTRLADNIMLQYRILKQ